MEYAGSVFENHDARKRPAYWAFIGRLRDELVLSLIAAASITELEADDADAGGDGGKWVATDGAHLDDFATPDRGAARAKKARKPTLCESENEQNETGESDGAGKDGLGIDEESDAGAYENEDNTDQNEDLDARQWGPDAAWLRLARAVEGTDTLADTLSRFRVIQIAENLFDFPFVSIGHKGPPAGAVSPSTTTARG
jgi:hypothetical protein